MMDCHTHTRYSPDSKAEPTDMVEAALAQGIRIYAITDHSDHCSNENDPALTLTNKEDWEADTQASFAMMAEMQVRYQAAPITLLRGIELGQPLQDQPLAEQILQREYDMVLGSLHNVSRTTDFFWLDYQNMTSDTLDQILSHYFEELLSMVAWGKFDSLAHLTYPLRYLKKAGIPLDGTGGPGDTPRVKFARYQEVILQILALLAKNEMALELNTSGLGRDPEGGFTMPARSELIAFRKLGGKYLTIGSDSHAPEQVGGGISAGLLLAKQAGFEQITYFQKRQPMLVPL